MDEITAPTPRSRASFYRASWRDGFWLALSITVAFLLSVSIPVGVITWAMNATGGGVARTLVNGFGGAFLLTASPVIFSRVFRELDFPEGRVRAKEARAVGIDREMARH